MVQSGARRMMSLFRRTPLHPQWLLGSRNAMAPRLDTIATGLVLDIGCADRWVEKQLHPGARYLGLDYLVTGKGMYGARPDIFADASQLPLADGSVDTVVILEVLEHLRSPRAALREIARVLRPRGRLLLTVPFLYPIHDAPHDYQRYTIHGLMREVEVAGLNVEQAGPSLGSSETAGLIACIAIGGMAGQAMERRKLSVLLLPLLALAIPIVNLLAWLGGRLLPTWPTLTAGYQLVASKP